MRDLGAPRGFMGGERAAELERLLSTLERLPADTPDLQRTLIKLGSELLYLTSTQRSDVPIERIITMLDRAAGGLEPGDPARVLAEGMCAGAIGLRAAIDHRTDGLNQAAIRLEQTASSTPPGHVGRPLTVLGEASILAERYVMTGELRMLEPAKQKVEEFFAELKASTIAWPDAGYGIGLHVRGILGIAEFRHFPERSEVLSDAIKDLTQAADKLGDDHPLHARLVAELGSARALQDMYRTSRGFQKTPASSDAMRAGFEQVRWAAEAVTSDHLDSAVLLAQVGGGLVLQSLADRDSSKLDEAITMFAAACATPALTTRERPVLLHSHGSALLLRYQMRMNSADLGNAIDRLEEARRATEQEDASPHASTVLQSLSEAYRVRADPRRGDIDRAVDVGIAALREHAGDVLLQDDEKNALGVSRTGAEDAFAMARWFLGRGRPGPAVSAIEFGRGMVLHAATVGAALPDVLRSAGNEALAQEWELERSGQAPGKASDLRYRTMVAIEGSPAEARLLATPSVEEIRAALAATATDALIYLLPQGDDHHGLAVIVDRAGSVTEVPLPALRAGPDSLLSGCERARREADRFPESEPGRAEARQRWYEILGELCDWAWRAAIGPLLAIAPATSHRQRRIVLVPVGQLGLVPWHASRREEGGLASYACEDVIFSYAVSARQFIDATELLPRRWAERPVLVTDSRDSLVATGEGIEYIRAHYYPAGTLFGSARNRAPAEVPGSPAATSQDILSVLPSSGTGGASVLHFGCHGRPAVPVFESYLDLGAGGKLRIGKVLQRAKQAKRTALPGRGGLVVLAACMSDLTETDHDEALTLATAFLSAGSSGVVGARWSISDAHTALFMVLFHRALSEGGTDPAQALRAAQLWMLDPGREPPDDLPKILRDEVGQPELADPGAWAAFTYQGR